MKNVHIFAPNRAAASHRFLLSCVLLFYLVLSNTNPFTFKTIVKLEAFRYD
jgi:hypothetical protein